MRRTMGYQLLAERCALWREWQVGQRNGMLHSLARG